MMNPIEFQKKHLANLNAFLATELGRDLMEILHNMRPPLACKTTEHETTFSTGEVSGYERCERNILLLCAPPKQMAKQPTQHYGVKDAEPQDDKKPAA
jgi:hypothetical protein